MAHLFPGDGDEHGAIMAAGTAVSNGQLRFLARELFCAIDGTDYVPGTRGYRMLTAEFIADRIAYCRENRLAYFAIHNHGGSRSVAFSDDDLASHERGYPTLLELAQGMPIGALVFARNAVAADIWFPDGTRRTISEMRVLGARFERLTDKPRHQQATDELYDRQIRMFGESGQDILRQTRVGIIGAGGVGSLLIEYLSRLGVGYLLVADPDKIEASNISRVVGTTAPKGKVSKSSIGKLKVDVGRDLAKQGNPYIEYIGIAQNFAKEIIARRFLDCDFLFLAADSMQARLVFNAIVHQYYIPGIQIGAKVITDSKGRIVDEAYSVYRWVLPEVGCLWCNGLISPQQLALEAKTEEERHSQAYGTAVPNPSVITLNAVAAAYAVNDFLMTWLGLANPSTFSPYRRFTHTRRDMLLDVADKDQYCCECSLRNGRVGLGDAVPLPTLS